MQAQADLLQMPSRSTRRPMRPRSGSARSRASARAAPPPRRRRRPRGPAARRSSRGWAPTGREIRQPSPCAAIVEAAARWAGLSGRRSGALRRRDRRGRRVGAALARELARFELRIALLDAATSGPERARRTRRSCTPASTPSPARSRRGSSPRARAAARYAQEVGIPLERTGALLVAWTEDGAGAAPRDRGERPAQRLRADRGPCPGRRSSSGASRTSAPARSGRFDPGRVHRLPLDAAARLRDAGGPGRGRVRRYEAVTGLGARPRRLGVRDLAGRLAGPLAGQRGRTALRRDAPARGLRRLHGDAAPRRADRVRQARARTARLPHPAPGADRAHEGGADRADGVRQRDARPDGRGHRGQARDRLDRRPGSQADRAGPAADARRSRARGDRRLRGPARRDRARRLPAGSSTPTRATRAPAASARPA